MSGQPAYIGQEQFLEYIAPGCDRLSFLQNYFLKNGVGTSVVSLQGKKHLYVAFPAHSYNPVFKLKTIICHYDRVPGSPGANDNSAANLVLASFATELFRSRKAHNVRIFFTDGEELGENGVASQGAFALADLFRKLGIVSDDVYVFDACGRGSVAVLARAGLNSVVSADFRTHFSDLYRRTENMLRSVFPNSWMTLPVPYSDNAGFLACGIPAVAITFLPKEEAFVYYKNLMADKNLEKSVMNSRTGSRSAAAKRSAGGYAHTEKLPATWRMLHTEMDSYENLTPESFKLLYNLLKEIAEVMILC